MRIYSQFAFLAETSATTLAASNLAVQALTIILGILFFSTQLTFYLGLGVAFTVTMSAVYTYLKLSKVLDGAAAPASAYGRATTRLRQEQCEAELAELTEFADADGTEELRRAHSIGGEGRSRDLDSQVR